MSEGPGLPAADHQTGPPSGHRDVPGHDAVLVVEQLRGQEVGSHCSCPRKDGTSSPGTQDCAQIRYVPGIQSPCFTVFMNI